MKNQNILISRIDAIGDVMLTIPVCGYLKSILPNSRIFFLGRSYTRSAITACSSIDEFLNYDDLILLTDEEQVSFLRKKDIDAFIHVFPNKHLARIAKKSQISSRIGTSHRWYHWFTCNRLVNLGRKRSDLHEAELNLRLLRGMGFTEFPTLDEIHQYYNFTNVAELPGKMLSLLNNEKFNLILHPKSHGSGKEWSLIRYKELIAVLPESRYNIFISGSEKEQQVLSRWTAGLEKPVINISGLMTLGQLIAFIRKADGLIASGTGPLHLAAASGIYTLGLFPGTKPIHAGRWGPVGKMADYLESDGDDLDRITADDVYQKIEGWVKNSKLH